MARWRAWAQARARPSRWLPAQNATGNWIKVVQRVPVRIALDPKEVAANPLRVGLSMLVEVDVRSQDGGVLAAEPRPHDVAHTDVFRRLAEGRRCFVNRIVDRNLGRGGPHQRRRLTHV